MDINKIEVLLRAIELGSFSKAAEEYSYTPSAVSHIADSIEDEIGIKFIKRTFTGVGTKDDCQEIVDNLKEIISIKNKITNIISNKNNKKIITIGTYSSLSKIILPNLIKEFNKQFPDMDINIIVDDKIKDIYKKGTADILFGEQQFNGEDIVWEELMCDKYMAVFPTKDEKIAYVISKEELSSYTFIMPSDERTTDYVSSAPLKHIISINSHDDSTIIQMVKQGIGISVLPYLSVVGSGNITYAELNPPLTRTLGLIYKKTDFKKNEHLRKFIEFIKQYMQKHK